MTTAPDPPPSDSGSPEEQRERAEERPALVGDRRPTPIDVSRRTAYIGAAVITGLIIFALWLVPNVVTIAIGGAAFALLLSYPVRVLDNYMPRQLAVLLTILGAVGVLAIAGMIVVPPIATQVTEFVEDLPGIVTDAEERLRAEALRLEEEGLLPADTEQRIGDLEAELGNRAGQSIEPLVTGVLGRITSILGLFITLFGILFVGITLLLDADRLRRKVTAAFPERYHDDLDQLWTDLGTSMSRYLGGLIAIMIVQGVLVAIGLFFLGIPYAVLLGLWVSITAIIPYVGAWLGAGPAIILALLGDPWDAVWVILLYFAVNILEGNFLTPRIQGDAVRVHPILVLLTVVAVGSLFGLLGVVLAVPMLAVGRVFFDFFRARVRITPTEPGTERPRQA
ncbi:MAG: AI-2E family transporter [Dehalococcoidia bacterium]|nr:AI-2E family transporter [Dehalococcoidia bacterium]